VVKRQRQQRPAATSMQVLRNDEIVTDAGRGATTLTLPNGSRLTLGESDLDRHRGEHRRSGPAQ
jgi:hypothetical protein